MALSGLDIYKLLAKTNCRECGFATCLAFAMALAKKAAGIEKCPYINEEAKRMLEASAQPPIKLLCIGGGEKSFEIGNESVMFRHEEKFHRPCGIGFILDDGLSDAQIKERLRKINKSRFERVGQMLEVNLVAVRQNKSGQRFCDAVKLVAENTDLALVLMSRDPAALKPALELLKARRPVIYPAVKDNLQEFALLAKEYGAILVITCPDLEGLSAAAAQLNKEGLSDILLDTGKKELSDKIWDLTQLRRLPLKRSNRSLGYPVLAVAEEDDPYEEALEAVTYIGKYAGIVLIRGIESWEVLSLLTLRQNIYTDPQKPLQIEPKLYSIGQVDDKSPVLVTTNFSLTYYTVLGEVEASKVPSYIMSVDTEGMSVLTAWAAEKFTPEKITATVNKYGVRQMVRHNRLIIPGYVAVMSGELEESSGCKVVVGPKEAAGLPSFLKNL
ncbi:MAG: acetyl-CoA decarbonylase/synthase complex subunit gamma [Candidatus Omnitrophica bacterium]|nr:acetyl-CoA decarbonylase/synthase complex subunit gamma [Candidatus Omnitrophota bacterium]